MRRFTPRFQGTEWTDGMGVLHVYAVPKPGVDDELLSLVQACRPALLEHPIDLAFPADPEDAGTLHVTIEMVADAPTARIDAAGRQDLIVALRTQLADVEPFVTQVGPPIGNVAGAVLDLWPEGQAVDLQENVRKAIRSTRGDAALQHSGGRLHMSLGYSYDTSDSDALNSRLRAITPRRAPMRVDSVHLLDVRFDIAPDTGAWVMSWTSLAEIPLGG
ncbi:2'-5' RNA ligase family protein [Streptomyces gossypiisoli]|uniref:hypothetical protein n=1 Tax=Streptomyces gossypiisoli TaxID=2748864 RepID=UPI0015DBAA20|nr:hypothetical protein [Streptomyces gossypiisoli]